MRITRLASCLLVAAAAACSGTAPSDAIRSASQPKPAPVPVSDNPYTLFETLQVRPLALSSDGKLLFAANTPDGRLEIFRVHKGRLDAVTSVPVGLEPIAVALRSDAEVWVVNHLSDSVSIVDVSKPEDAHVTRTLLVGDEPRDIVFGGTGHDRAFITTAHRGQNSPDDPDLFNPATGRADVWVFDANNLGTAAGGTRLTKITLFADTPRALAVTPDGKTVYAAAFFSGNQTTSVSVDAVKQVYGGVMPTPNTITVPGLGTLPQPPTGLIVKYIGGHWLDVNGKNFDAYVRVSLPDQDVFAIDATANPPVAGASFAHVGTTLFNMAVNPANGKVYVSNTDAHNDVRFEGHNAGVSSVRGNIVDSRISVIDPTAKTVTAVNLNTHINHDADTGDASLSRAFPQDLTFSSDGKKVYVVAQGSGKLAVYDTAQLEQGNAAPTTANQVVLAAGGPAGVVLDAYHDQAFVLTRFDNGISIVDATQNSEVAHQTLFNPEPKSVTDGRQYLYDAAHTSAHGDQACASCHVGGDFDGLAWDLGNPGGIPLKMTDSHKPDDSDVFTIPRQILFLFLPEAQALFSYFMPLKGPMTTQSLRGMDNHGSMHWRGDRNGFTQQNGAPFLDGSGNPVQSAQPNSGIFDEFRAFTSFNVAFPGLVGNGAQLSDADMAAFATFILQVSYPPNPIRNLDNSLTPEQAAGRAFFFNQNPDGSELASDRFHNCAGCHVLDPNGNAGATRHPGFFGTDGRLSFENETQIFKVPHLRNVYQKVGMFGTSPDPLDTISMIPPLNPTVTAVRGFGYQHDGVIGSPEHFFGNFVFLLADAPIPLPNGKMAPPNPGGIPLGNNPNNPTDFSAGFSTDGFKLRRALSSFVFAFDSNLAPIVGQQITLTSTNAASAGPRIDLLEARAAKNECDLVVHGRSHYGSFDFTYSAGAFVASSASAPLSDASVRALIGAQKGPDALTFTCTPPGLGWRAGVDRDGDGFADVDELAWGSDPANPASHP